MSEEVYYYVVYFVDGETQTFTRDNDELTATFKDVDRDRVMIDNTIINMHNVVRVKIETKTEREEKEKIQNKQSEDNLKAMTEMLKF